MELSRKEFVLGSLAAAGAALMGVACGDDTTSSGGSNAGGAAAGGSSAGGAPGTGGSATTGGAPGTGGTTATGGAPGTGGGAPAGCTETIATNHGHVLEVSVDDVNAGVEKVYDITGSSMHSHSVTIGAADFALLAQGMPVMVVSSTGGMHTHNVTVTCTV